MSDTACRLRVKLTKRWSASSSVPLNNRRGRCGLRSIQCQRGHQPHFPRMGQIQMPLWDRDRCEAFIASSPKLHTKRQRQRSILHFLDVLASGNSYSAMRPHGTDACGLCFQSVHQLGFRCAWFDASASNVWPSSPIRVCHGSSIVFSKPHPRQEPWWFLPNERLKSPSCPSG
jgi:hypothetical protein